MRNKVNNISQSGKGYEENSKALKNQRTTTRVIIQEEISAE